MLTNVSAFATTTDAALFASLLPLAGGIGILLGLLAVAVSTFQAFISPDPRGESIYMGLVMGAGSVLAGGITLWAAG